MSPQKSDSPGWHITHSRGSMWQEEAECVPCSRCQLINRAAAMWVPEDRPAGPTSGSKEVYSPCRGQRWGWEQWQRHAGSLPGRARPAGSW